MLLGTIKITNYSVSNADEVQEVERGAPRPSKS